MAMVAIDGVIKLLERALEPGADLVDCVKQFQQAVWDRPGAHDEEDAAWDTLRTLAYDLDFLEPNSRSRAEDSAFFDHQRARAEISAALSRLQSPQASED